MTVPVFIRYQKTDEKSQQKIADAVISLVDGNIIVKSIMLADLPGNAVLSEKTRAMVENIRDVQFRDNTSLPLNADAQLQLNVSSFHLEMIVSQDALTEAIVVRSSLLGPSSVNGLSNVLNYNFGSYYNNYRNGNSSRSYLTLDNTTSVREHHLNINGSFYGIGESSGTSKVYRAMYERDYEGYRLALGMLDTWNLQSIASLNGLNGLNGGKIYGASYGNKGSTVVENTSLSLTPIKVFLPAAGEVHIFREGRLLSVQNFNMGSYEIDTSRFPYGVYDVTVDVVINGRKVNTMVSRVNKIFANRQAVGLHELSWQVFAGVLDYDRVSYKRNRYRDLGNDQTWIGGGAASMTLAILSGLSIKSTTYGFDSNAVNETDLTLSVNEYLNVGTQTLVANDRSWRNISNVNLSAPGGFGSLWASREDSKIGDRLPVQERDNYSIGGTLNLGRFIPHGGSLTVSQTENRHSDNKYRNMDYSTTLYSGRYATVGLRAGIQRYYYNNVNDDGRQERYVSLDLSLPLASWLSVGMSRDRYGSTQGSVSTRKQFSEGAIKSVGLSASTRMSGEQHYDNNYSVNGNLSYDTKYNAGTVSVTRSADNSTNMNFSSQGSVAWAGGDFGLSRERQRSGIIVKTNIVGDGKLAAKVNNRNYVLSGNYDSVSVSMDFRSVAATLKEKLLINSSPEPALEKRSLSAFRLTDFEEEMLNTSLNKEGAKTFCKANSLSIKSFYRYRDKITNRLDLSNFNEAVIFLCRNNFLGNMTMKNENSARQDTHPRVNDSHEASLLSIALINNEIIPYYQPVIGREGELCGVEVLARWPKGHNYTISQREFIPLAESSGLINELTSYLMNQVAKDFNQNLELVNKDFFVAFNISPSSLNNPVLYWECLNFLEKTASLPIKLMIEITENQTLSVTPAIKELIRSLRNRGVMFALDDFGTGYANLCYLNDLELDVIKIDKIFIKQISEKVQTIPMLSSIVNLAGMMGLRTIAEGVEYDYQREWLISNQVDYMQGYHYSPPVDFAEFRRYVQQTNP